MLHSPSSSVLEIIKEYGKQLYSESVFDQKSNFFYYGHKCVIMNFKNKHTICRFWREWINISLEELLKQSMMRLYFQGKFSIRAFINKDIVLGLEMLIIWLSRVKCQVLSGHRVGNTVVLDLSPSQLIGSISDICQLTCRNDCLHWKKREKSHRKCNFHEDAILQSGQTSQAKCLTEVTKGS